MRNICRYQDLLKLIIFISVNKMIFKIFITCILTLSFACSLSSQKKILEVYEVQKGETLQMIANKHHVTIEELKLANPDIKKKKEGTKLSQGYLLNIPVQDTQNILDSKKVTNLPNAIDTIKLAVILPFSGKGAIAERVLEYYRGLLIAGFAAKESGYVAIFNTIEEPNQNEPIIDSLVKVCSTKPDFLVGPLYPSHFQEVSNFVQAKKIRTLIPFSSRTTEVNENPFLYILNTPDNIITEKSKQLFNNTFTKSSQIIIVRTPNPNKKSFIQEMENHWGANKLSVNTLPSRYVAEDLVRVLHKTKQNIIMLDGNDEKEAMFTLNSISEFKKQNPTYKISVLGYGEWQSFAMDESDLFFSTDTYLFSSDYYNAYNSGVITFEERYFKWFEQYPKIHNPRMGELGYDSGIYMLNAIAIYGNKYIDQSFSADYLQTNLRFESFNSKGGYVNTGLIFIHYKPNRKIEIIQI